MDNRIDAPDVLRRFRKYSPHRPDGCWLWTGVRNNSGYGRMSILGRYTLAHRVSYCIHVGPIPDGLLVLHKCDNPACVRPDHLFLGDHRANTQDQMDKGRWRGGYRRGRRPVVSDDGLRDCFRCKRLLDLGEFTPSRPSWCRECAREYRRSYYKAHPRKPALTAEQKAEIRASYSWFETTIRELASKYGVSASTIFCTLKQKP